MREVLVELPGADRLDTEATVDRLRAGVGPDHQAPIVEALVDDVVAVRIIGQRHVRSHCNSAGGDVVQADTAVSFRGGGWADGVSEIPLRWLEADLTITGVRRFS